jgi:hypothetical protein
LDILIPEIKHELKDYDLTITYLSPGLHNDCKTMEAALTKHLSETSATKTVVLYGSACHTEIATILKNYHAALPKEKNCIEIILKPEIKTEMDKSGNIFYLTAGWLKNWREVFLQNTGMATIIADKIVYLDCGATVISDEDIIEFFDFANVPLEIKRITLDNFRDIVIKLCKTLHA